MRVTVGGVEVPATNPLDGWKQSRRACTTVALAASTEVSGVRTANANGALGAVDGATLVAGTDSILDRHSTAALRGLWDVVDLGSAGTPWVLRRSLDANSSQTLTSGSTVEIQEGTVNAGLVYTLTTPNPLVVGTTAQTWTAGTGSLPLSVVTTAGDLIQGTGAGAVARLAAAAAGKYLRSAGAGNALLWSTLTLPDTTVSGDTLIATGTNAVGAVTAVALGQVYISQGVGVAPVWSSAPTLTSLTVTTVASPAATALTLNGTATAIDLQVAGTTHAKVFASGTLWVGTGTARDHGANGDITLAYGGGLFTRNASDTVYLTMINVVGGDLVVGATGYSTIYAKGSAFRSEGRVAGVRKIADAAATLASATDETLVYTSLTAARSITVPASLTGQVYTVKDGSGNCSPTKVLTITPAAGTIEGAASITITSPYGYATIQFDGTNWSVVAKSASLDADAAGLSDGQVIRVAFTAGTPGTADDVTLYAANLPRKYRVLDTQLLITTAIAAQTVQLRDAAAGAGNALSDLFVCTAVGRQRDLGVGIANVTPTVAANGSIYLRRSDRGLAGEIILWVRPEA